MSQYYPVSQRKFSAFILKLYFMTVVFFVSSLYHLLDQTDFLFSIVCSCRQENCYVLFLCKSVKPRCIH